jgi:cyclopropane fatty-acyl-phospholipid synthase-like methyltransferase
MRIAVLGNMDVDGEEGVEIKRFDIKAFYPNSKLDGFFDRIFASNSLPELGRDEVMRFLEKVHNALAEDGQFIVQVPMAEWAAKQLFTNKADAMTYYMLYGNDEHPFKACYTMMQIRTLLARAGFNVHEATEAILKLSTVEGETLDLPVHSLIAVINKDFGGK